MTPNGEAMEEWLKGTSLYVKKGQVQVVGLFRSFIKSLSSRSNSQHMFERIKLSEADSESVR